MGVSLKVIVRRFKISTPEFCGDYCSRGLLTLENYFQRYTVVNSGRAEAAMPLKAARNSIAPVVSTFAA